MSDDPTDAALIEASWTDPERFSAIFDRHYQAVFAFVARTVGPTSGADLASEVFTRAFATRRRYDLAYTSARPWLFGIAWNVIKGYVRGRARELKALNRAATSGQKPYEFDEETVNRVAAEAETANLRRSLGTLRSEEAAVVLLFALEDFSYKQIAHALGIPEGTVRSRLSRARTKLRNLMDQGGEIGPR